MKFAEAEIVNGPVLQRARGIGRITAKQVGERTRLDTLFQEGCGKIRLPNTHSSSLEAVLINTSRGPLVNEEALVEALRQGWIGGAGLDVFDLEPLPLDHPLRRLDNVIATPHLGYVTRETYEGYFNGSVECIASWLDGAPVRILNG